MDLINVMASSVDGKIALSSLEGDSARIAAGLSSDSDHAHLKYEIGLSDAIIVGAGSIRSNGECLSYPGRSGLPPTWYIYAENEIPLHYPFWSQDDIPRVIVSSKEIPIHSDKVDFRCTSCNLAEYVYRDLKEAGFQRVLLFGGGKVNSWYYELGLVDQLKLTLAPVIAGMEKAPPLILPNLTETVSMTLQSSKVVDSFVFLTYDVKRKKK